MFPGAKKFIPKNRPSIQVLREAAKECEGCDLYLHATQTVFGEGNRPVKIFFIGEQPGNDEDLQGKPFVGPAGKLLDQALQEAGIDRAKVYVTNVVKHFKFEERGKRRIHKKPSSSEVHACRPWLEAEVELLKPKVIVCLGATAAQALMGPKFRLTQDRGHALEHPWAPALVATIHPSAILRIPDKEGRHAEFARFVSDLQTVRSLSATS